MKSKDTSYAQLSSKLDNKDNEIQSLKDSHKSQMDAMTGGGGNDALIEQLREELTESEEANQFNMDMFNMQTSELNREMDELREAAKNAANPEEVEKSKKEVEELKKKVAEHLADKEKLQSDNETLTKSAMMQGMKGSAAEQALQRENKEAKQ